jgi:glycerol-3-phosphate dehydrogenase
MQRELNKLFGQGFDLLILGGGITGAGVALDASLRGLRVALVDKSDFASGTSSVSSKLIHGGLRYLEHGQFRLVYEALSERRLLLRNAPHLVRPLRFLLPFYRDSRLPLWKGMAGLWMYDLLAGRQNLAKSRRLTLKSMQAEVPGLRAKDLLGAAEYYDAQMDDARLCLEVVQTAWHCGATVANYVVAIGFERRNGIIEAVQVRDQISGAEGVIHARQVLNATGPWVDAVEMLAGGSGGEERLQPTKGVHIILPDLGLNSAFLLLHPTDGRVFFVIPWMRRTLIGTTDAFTSESPDHLAVMPAEVDYLLAGYNHHFERPFQASDILGRFAGLRPLLKAKPNHPSARSREFALWEGPAGMLSVGGGKFTTYRHMAEVITDAIARRLGNRVACRTRHVKLNGAPVEAWAVFVRRELNAFARRGLPAEFGLHLLNRYGRQARGVASVALAVPHGLEHVVPLEPELIGEMEYQKRFEMAILPEDHWRRRTRLGLYHDMAACGFAGK